MPYDGAFLTLGLANDLFNGSSCEALDMNDDDYERIFIDLGDELGLENDSVTPEHVADAIDAYLAARQPRNPYHTIDDARQLSFI